MNALVIFLILSGWLLLFVNTAGLAARIQDKRITKREAKIIEEYEKEFD